MMELLGRQNNVGFTFYGERLKKLRKVLQRSLNSRIFSAFWSDLLNEKSLELCYALLQSPTKWNDILESNIQELIVLFAYGHQPSTEYIKLAKTVMHQTGEAFQPGRWAVNFIPALKWVPAWLPGAGFQKWARESRELFFEVTRQPFYDLKNEMVCGSLGNVRQSFVQQNLESLSKTHSIEDEDVIMFAAGSLFSAGTETLTVVFLNFIALMANHPEIQQRAFDEIQTIIGSERLPNLQQRDSLPFIDCIIQEVHRMYPPIPLMPHSNVQEEKYNGYRIPKKSWVMANVWAMLHDDQVYPNPESFLPSRFEGLEPALDPRVLTYGRCPGLHFADLYIYLLVARVLILFEIVPGVEDGKPVYPVLEFTAGLVAFPKPYTCRLVPRKSALEILKKSGERS
ncbi:cytochrome P450 [Desarmillaria tabescens]|uniref:Cytochrome P450 n=1 Tax=Armillaria tabescens TaxID=1929756 RepID=A0AA39N7P1_ARMTA|nr:cytochrome P450 [Desarmillaria tabescens]KAK0460550.1 cytochrome P450 [Desarmillaria tabescens]